MNNVRTAVAAIALSIVATAAQAAVHPFYTRMLQRGVASVEAGAHDEGVKELRIAAFGLLEDPASYEKAQVYLAIAHEKLGHTGEAKLAATKFLQAERMRPAYESLQLGDAMKASFEKIVATAVEPEYLASIPAFRRATPQPLGTLASAKSDSAALPNTIAAQIEKADALLNEGKLIAARGAFAQLAARADLERPDVLAVAQGLNRAGAFAESSAAYAKAQPLRAGEEPHMFLEAMNRFELGDLKTARSLFDKAAPKLPQSREVELFRSRLARGF